jgi:Flp pilus assembly protein TadB
VTSLLVVAALLAGAAAALASGGPQSGRAHRLDSTPEGARSRANARGEPDADRGLRWARPAALLAAAAVWLLVGGWWGVVAGMATAVILPAVVRRLEPARERLERLELIRTAPLVADLLSAALAAGVPAGHALAAISRAVGGATAGVLEVVQRRLELGEPPERAWGPVMTRPGLAGIARAVARSSRTGAPLAALLAAAAVDLRADAAAAALTQVRSASVRAVLPLGLCLLPSFGLLGIVPIVAGLLPPL